MDICITILETEMAENGEYIPCIVKKGEGGYWKTNWSWGTDLELARKCAKKYNTKLGITEEQEFEMVLESMRIQNEEKARKRAM